jgi:hypothetical protein
MRATYRTEKNLREINSYGYQSQTEVPKTEENKPFSSYTISNVFKFFEFPTLLHDRLIKTLLDTGADVNVIDYRLLQENDYVQKSHITLKTASGSSIKIFGESSIECTIKNKNIQLNTIVADLGEAKLILGLPFIQKHIKNIRINKEQADFELSISNIQESMSEQMKAKFESLTVQNDDNFGMIKGTTHRIHLTDDIPVVKPMYRLPVNYECEVEDQLQELLEKNIIRPSKSPYCSPIVPIRKKDGRLRLCID